MVEKLTSRSGQVLRDAVTRMFQKGKVAEAAYAFSRHTAAGLRKDGDVIEDVGKLLVDAINTNAAGDVAATWFVDIPARDDTVGTIERLL
ncbi:glutaredoxin family protein, putative [Babesia ovata]|uniref:Glutaredoxin family protein, putative n=1 Tax=Babesia ovata TaxID=189622 RepID=A0A2H6K6N3_9APIC|nr:glutaredoxin family protein, putative [Babesia ovata]GBE58639.1 glutaredoxin family protein, putative [Babesia ovata]